MNGPGFNLLTDAAVCRSLQSFPLGSIPFWWVLFLFHLDASTAPLCVLFFRKYVWKEAFSYLNCRGWLMRYARTGRASYHSQSHRSPIGKRWSIIKISILKMPFRFLFSVGVWFNFVSGSDLSNRFYGSALSFSGNEYCLMVCFSSFRVFVVQLR